MKKKVYLCSPLGGNVRENLEKVKRYAAYALKEGVVPIVPHFYALCLDDNIPAERELGISAGLSLLWYCDEIWVFGDLISAGMQREIDCCNCVNMPMRKITGRELEQILGGNSFDQEEISDRYDLGGDSADSDDGDLLFHDIGSLGLG